jgi:hypothetical protein
MSEIKHKALVIRGYNPTKKMDSIMDRGNCLHTKRDPMGYMEGRRYGKRLWVCSWQESNIYLEPTWVIGKKTVDSVNVPDDWEIVKDYKQDIKKLNTEDEFNTLATAWKIQTGHFSTTFHKVNNTNYLKIIGMGEKALPYILRDLEEAPEHWFVALNSIAKPEINPVNEEDFGDMTQMSKAWVNWGRENNII